MLWRISASRRAKGSPYEAQEVQRVRGVRGVHGVRGVQGGARGLHRGCKGLQRDAAMPRLRGEVFAQFGERARDAAHAAAGLLLTHESVGEEDAARRGRLGVRGRGVADDRLPRTDRSVPRSCASDAGRQPSTALRGRPMQRQNRWAGQTPQLLSDCCRIAVGLLSDCCRIAARSAYLREEVEPHRQHARAQHIGAHVPLDALAQQWLAQVGLQHLRRGAGDAAAVRVVASQPEDGRAVEQLDALAL